MAQMRHCNGMGRFDCFFFLFLWGLGFRVLLCNAVSWGTMLGGPSLRHGSSQLQTCGAYEKVGERSPITVLYHHLLDY